jgi:hypothetical protein
LPAAVANYGLRSPLLLLLLLLLPPPPLLLRACACVRLAPACGAIWRPLFRGSKRIAARGGQLSFVSGGGPMLWAERLSASELLSCKLDKGPHSGRPHRLARLVGRRASRRNTHTQTYTRHRAIVCPNGRPKNHERIQSMRTWLRPGALMCRRRSGTSAERRPSLAGPYLSRLPLSVPIPKLWPRRARASLL